MHKVANIIASDHLGSSVSVTAQIETENKFFAKKKKCMDVYKDIYAQIYKFLSMPCSANSS